MPRFVRGLSDIPGSIDGFPGLAHGMVTYLMLRLLTALGDGEFIILFLELTHAILILFAGSMKAFVVCSLSRNVESIILNLEIFERSLVIGVLEWCAMFSVSVILSLYVEANLETNGRT